MESSGLEPVGEGSGVSPSIEYGEEGSGGEWEYPFLIGKKIVSVIYEIS